MNSKGLQKLKFGRQVFSIYSWSRGNQFRLRFNFQYKPSSYSFSQTLSSKLLWEQSFSRAWCHCSYPQPFFFFPKEKFPQLLFHPFTDKNTPRALIKHFCAPSSKPIPFTLNLAPNKGKWVSHFEAEQWFFFHCFVSGTLSSEDLWIQSTA